MMTNKEYDDDIDDNYDDVDMLCREARVLTAGEHVMEKIKMTSSWKRYGVKKQDNKQKKLVLNRNPEQSIIWKRNHAVSCSIAQISNTEHSSVETLVWVDK